MAAVVSLLLIIALSLLITRIASVAFVHTGLSREVARFQARYAFSGVGFSTSEAESIVGHPVRRRIVLTMIASTMIPEAVHLGGGSVVGLSTLIGFLSAISFKLLEV